MLKGCWLTKLNCVISVDAGGAFNGGGCGGSGGGGGRALAVV